MAAVMSTPINVTVKPMTWASDAFILKKREIEDEDQHRNAGLKDDALMALVYCTAEYRNALNIGEADGAIGKQLQPVLADLLPVAAICGVIRARMTARRATSARSSASSG